MAVETKIRLDVRDHMTEKLLTCTTEDSLSRAIKLMSANAISCIIVVNGKNQPKGIITERDMIKRIIAANGKVEERALSQVMSAPVHVVKPTMSILEVSRLMRAKKIRQFPVVDGSTLVGLVTETDIMRGLIRYIHHLNWCVVGEELTKEKCESMLTEIKGLVNS